MLESSLSPGLLDKLVRLSSHLPFRLAVRLFEDFWQVSVSWETARTVCEEAGQLYVEYQTEEVERLERELPESEAVLPHAVVSVDGAMVPLVGGEWAEVKTVVLGAVQLSQNEAGESLVQSSQLSYFSRLLTAQEFGRAALVETHRRGLSESSKVSAVMDGAEWLQGFIDLHCPKATRILDFPHAAQRIAGIGEALWGVGSAETKIWLAAKLHQLKHKGAEEVLSELEQLQVAHPTSSLLLENLTYLKRRQAQIQYDQFRAAGHPIGSGIVESANKLVVQARLKGAGMHWGRANVNAILALRNAECNGRWQETWQQICTLKQKALQTRRQALRLDRSALPNLVSPTTSPPPEKPIISRTPAAITEKTAYCGKPAPDHPWRKAKLGKAKFELAKVG